ncbi:SAM-dependent methyltransferase [Actinomycetospora sp. OC33-EN08]|uniref:S-adenosyl-L-methionine-dependent methyltransferase n=1 Tax=Actinomycetospora aurantiaca TaxID=3129233 RepID=A0ABU8MT73_9PSEU
MAERTSTWDINSSVGTTAVIAAASRAIDTHRHDRLVNDPYAEALVAATHPRHPIPTRPSPDAPNWRAMSDLLGTRSRFFDDVLRLAMSAGVRQVVILASGLDTRTHRLDWPSGTTVYEIDQPEVLEFKRQVLVDLGAHATCRHRVVPHDLRDDWMTSLVGAGFRRDDATVWIAEGLFYYLTPQAQQALLEAVDDNSAPGSRWAIEDDLGFLDRMSDPTARTVSESMGIDLTTLLEAGPRPASEVWLRDRRWVVESRTLRTAAVEYHRDLDPLTERTNGSFLLTHGRSV